MATDDTFGMGTKKSADWKRFVPLGLIACGMVAGLFFLRDLLSFEALEANYQALTAWRDANFGLAVVVFMAAYILLTVFSIPGAIWVTMLGGFLFGVVAGTAMVVTAATIGATLLFIAARTALGDLLRDKAGKWVATLEEKFQRGEISFLLIMRLIPVVPFFIANLAPAFLGARLINFVWTTFAGIIPGTIVFISIGAGLGEQLGRGVAPDLGVIFEWHVLGPLLGLAALSALPLVLRALGIGKQS